MTAIPPSAMNTTRNLIQRLADELTNAIRVIHNEDGTQHISTAAPVLDEARVYLAQSETEGVEDRIAKLEADLERERPATRLLSYKVGKAEPIENWGKGHTLVDPPATTAKPHQLIDTFNQLENN